MRLKLVFLAFITSLILTSAVSEEKKTTPQEYIETYKMIAISEMLKYNIPASITLAQGILESGNGNSELAREANNHFGIKCHKDWTGKRYYHDDDEKDECFRVYKNAEQSYIDHSQFLLGKQRYAFLFEYKRTDYKSWAKGLKKAGYATNPKYPQLLIGIIERYNLDQYDKITEKEFKKMQKERGKQYQDQDSVYKHELVQTQTKDSLNLWNIDSVGDPDAGVAIGVGHKIIMHNNIKCIVLRDGDNLDQIAQETGISKKLLYKYNDMGEGTHLQKGQKFYLQPKRGKGSAKYHVVEKGETMWDISQKYGIKLSKLYKRNHIQVGETVKAGTKLWLRKNKPMELVEAENNSARARGEVDSSQPANKPQ